MSQPWYPQQPAYAGARPPSRTSLMIACVSSIIFAGGLVVSVFDAFDYVDLSSTTTAVLLLLRLPCAVAAVIGAVLLFATRSNGRYVVIGSVVALCVMFVVNVATDSSLASDLDIVFKSQTGRVGYVVLLGILAAVLSVVPPTSRYLRYATAGAAPNPPQQAYPQQWYPPQGYAQQGHPPGYPYQGPQPPRA